MHPILLRLVFQIPLPWYGEFPVNFAIHTYGVILMIGFIIALWCAVAAARRRPEIGIGAQDIVDVSVWMLLAGVVFARLTYVLLDPNWRSYQFSDVLAIWDGGISFDGALFGGVLALVIYAYARKISAFMLLDLIAPSVALGYAIGRVRCFFNGCCYGRPTDLPWGVRFPAENGIGLTVPSHPVQLYSTLMSLLLFAFLAYRQTRPRAATGEIVSLYLIGSALERFIMEIFRAGATSDLVRGTPFTTAQFFCFFLFLIGFAGLALAFRVDRAKRPGPQSRTPSSVAT